MNRRNILMLPAVVLLVSLPAFAQTRQRTAESPKTIVIEKGEVIQLDTQEKQRLQNDVNHLMEQMSASLRKLDQKWAITNVKNSARTATTGTWPRERRPLATGLVRLDGPVNPTPSPTNNIAVVYEKTQ